MGYTDQCSFYFSVFENRPVEMTLEEFVGYIRGERWKAHVEEYHRLMALGEKSKAKELKNRLPGLVIAGRCEGSHAEENLKEWSGDGMFDVDHCKGHAVEFLRVLEKLPWAKAGWRSISQDRVKLVVRIEAENGGEYRLAYAIVAWHIQQAIGFPCDMSCKNPTRPCFASYDSEAFFHAGAAVFPWRGFLREFPGRVKEILAELKVKHPFEENVAPLVAGTPIPASGFPSAPLVPGTPIPASVFSAAPFVPGTSIPAPGFPSAPLVPASGILRTFFNNFLSHNAFMDGKKNDFLLKLGRVARYKGVTGEELEQLKGLAVERLAGADCAAADIPPRIDSGYRYADVNEPPQNASFWAHKAQGSLAPLFEPENGGESAVSEGDEGDRVRRSAPYLPDDLFDRLPAFLQDGLRMVRNKRERDILLLSMIANISGCLPGVRMNYAGVLYSADLYFVALAGAGRGKGVMQLAALLPDAIQRHYDEYNKKKMGGYKKDLLEWNLEERKAVVEKRIPDIGKCPEEPVLKVFKVAPNISKSQLIMALEAGGPVGVVMNASEMDMVSSAMHQDYGKHDEVLRSVFHHEEVSSFFKTDKRLVVASDPHMALCVSGTPAQLHRFISSLENGLYSRVSFYIGQAKWRFDSADPGEERRDSRACFREMSEELLRMFLFLEQSPTEVIFTKKQWEEHMERFRTYLYAVVTEDDDSPGAIVLRHGLMAARVAMVLTALRKCEPKWNTSEWKCSDDDFHSAMQIVDVLLEHSLLLSTGMESEEKKHQPLRNFYRIRPVLRKMPVLFSYSELLEAALERQISASSLKRYLPRLLEYQIIVKEDGMYRKTSKSWPK